MSEQQRWVLFFILSFAVMLMFSIRESKREQERQEYRKAQAEAEAKEQQARELVEGDGLTTATLAALKADGASTEAIRAAYAEASRKAAVESAAAPLIDNDELKAQRREEWLNAERHVITNGDVRVEISEYGGRIESWKIVNPRYSATYKLEVQHDHADADPAEYGDELVMNYPLEEGVPRRPLEVSLVANSRRMDEFNNSIWDINIEEDQSGGNFVTMTSPVVDGMRIVKKFHLPGEGFSGNVTLRLENRSDSNIRVENEERGLGVVAWGPGLGDYQEQQDYFDVSMGLYYTDEVRDYYGDDLPKILQEPGILWSGLSNKYMLGGLMEVEGTDLIGLRSVIPPGYTKQKNFPEPMLLELFVEPFTLGAQRKKSFEYVMFAAPKDQKILNSIGKEMALPRSIMHDSWNWFRAICLGMIWLLEFFHGWVGSWGWAIVALTVTMKIITHPINHRALRINAEFQRQMAKIKPELDALTEEHKDKPQEKMMAQQRLMKKHGINPFAPMKGCFPMLLQIPIFFALYRIIGQSISLRGESFLWIDDLAAPDALVQDVIFGMDLNLLPLLMVATQILSMLLSSRATATDPNQRMIMFIMPIMMLLFLYNFASGLFVYWVAQNCWQIGHTLLTNKEVEHEAEEREHQQEEEEKTKAAALTTSASKNRRKKKAATANANK